MLIRQKNFNMSPNIHYKIDSKERCSYNEKDLLLAWLFAANRKHI